MKSLHQQETRHFYASSWRMSIFRHAVYRPSRMANHTHWFTDLLFTRQRQILPAFISLNISNCLNHYPCPKHLCKRHFYMQQRCFNRSERYFSKLLQNVHTLVSCQQISSNYSTFTLEDDLFKSYIEHLEEEYKNERTVDGEIPSEERMEALRKIVNLLHEAREKYSEMEELNELEKDESLKAIVIEDKERCAEQIEEIEQMMVSMLLPADNKYDNRDVILEVECGAGGTESMLFAFELLNMYQRYAAFKGWNWDLISLDKGSFGEPAIRKASVSVSGVGVHGRFKYEGGVHRVKRNPVTDPGRIHTSTVSVAVLFQPSKIDLVIDEKKDLIIETCRASGPGGQNIQKTESNVRIKHIPTGLVAESQETRSQHMNKERALKQLTAKIMDMEMQKTLSEVRSQRKIQVGGKARSERIRTYMYSKDIVIEHRLNKQFKNIPDFLTGGETLDTTIDELREAADVESLQIKLEEFQHKQKLDAKQRGVAKEDVS